MSSSSAAPAVPPHPLPGLVNSLSSHPTSSLVSILTSTTHTISNPPNLPCDPAHPAPSTSHTAFDGNRFAYTHNKTLYFQIPPDAPVSHPTPLPFESLSMALSLTPTSHLVALASQNGVHVTSLSLEPPYKFSPLSLLPSTTGHFCIAVSINPRACIAAANLAGQIAVYNDLHSPATHMIPLPKKLHLADRITQISFTSSALVVAWWSGELLAYSPNATLLWRHTFPLPKSPALISCPSFATRSGTFFALDESQTRAVFVTGTDLLLFADITTPTWAHAQLVSDNPAETLVITDVCVCKSGIYTWVRGNSTLLSLIPNAWPFPVSHPLNQSPQDSE